MDLLSINVLAYICFVNGIYVPFTAIFLSISWLVIAKNIQFYEVYRFTKPFQIWIKIIKQTLYYVITITTFLFFFKANIRPLALFVFLLAVLIAVGSLKFLVFYSLQKFRLWWGGNHRKVVIFGTEKNTLDLYKFFKDNPDFGYHVVHHFYQSEDYANSFEKAFAFIKENHVDEMYCAVADFGMKQVSLLIDFADNNLKVIKFLPDKKDRLFRHHQVEYYDYVPVISLRTSPLDILENRLLKRLFDILFSLFVLIFIMSWLFPIVALCIKLDSKGPVIFKQKRNGLYFHEFTCYKFRSMKLNDKADVIQVSKYDERITRVGKFLRKSSIDEMPQFFNVLLGNMSVVGPRPHMLHLTDLYAKTVDKFMVRHLIKPGITGMAQINGFRGEIEEVSHITNRVKYDIFYLENWSVFLDIRIVIVTLFKMLFGDEKAY